MTPIHAEALQRSDSMAEVAVAALGVHITIKTIPEQALRVRNAWTGARPNSHGASAGPVRSVPAQQPHETELDLAGLSSRVTLAAIEARRGELTMLHACGLATTDGAVAVFVGPSGRGKTTVAATLGRHYGYVSDETIGIGTDGSVAAYRKPLSILRAPGTPKEQLSPDALGLLGLPSAPLHVVSVIVLDRTPDAPARPELRRLDLVEALPLLVPNLSYLGEQPGGLRVLSELADSVGGFASVRYRDATDLVAVAAELFSCPLPVVSSVTGSYEVTAAGPGAATDASGFARRPGVQWLEVEHRTITLGHGQVRILDGIGPVIWRALAEPADLDGITRAVLTALGPPPAGDATDQVRQALVALTDLGLVIELAQPEDPPA